MGDEGVKRRKKMEAICRPPFRGFDAQELRQPLTMPGNCPHPVLATINRYQQRRKQVGRILQGKSSHSLAMKNPYTLSSTPPMTSTSDEQVSTML